MKEKNERNHEKETLRLKETCFVDIYNVKNEEVTKNNEIKEKVKKKKYKVIDALVYKSKEYRSTFTVHGLTKVFTGNWFEKLFWGTTILLSLCTVISIVSTLAVKYNKRETYTKVHTREYSASEMPVLTICPTDMSQQSSTSNLTYNVFMDSNRFYEWRNEYINLIVYYGMKEGYSISEFIKPSYYNCIRMELGFLEMSLKPIISFETIYQNSVVEVYVHDAEERFPFLQKKVLIFPNNTCEVSIEMREYKRLQYPFPSNCVENVDYLIYPSKYSKHKCQESLRCLHALKTCGASFIDCEVFLPEKEKFTHDETITNNRENISICLNSTHVQNYDSKCKLPCKERIFSTIVSNSMLNSVFSLENVNEHYTMVIDYPLSPYYHVYEESELYAFAQLLSECGGLFGLFTGSSAISFVEVIFFISLLILKKSWKDNKRNN